MGARCRGARHGAKGTCRGETTTAGAKAQSHMEAKQVHQNLSAPSLLPSAGCRSMNLVLKSCKAVGALKILMRLIIAIALSGVCLDVTLDQNEFFAGRHECTKAAWRRHKTAIPYEIQNNGVFYNMCSGMGLNTCLTLIMKTKSAAGITPLAPVCSSWVPINLGTSQRTPANPLGNTSCPHVRDANKMVCRTILAIYLTMALAIPWFLEQPKGSMMQGHPDFQLLLARMQIFRHYLSILFHGGESAKGTWLYSPFEWMRHIDDYGKPPASRDSQS